MSRYIYCRFCWGKSFWGWIAGGWQGLRTPCYLISLLHPVALMGSEGWVSTAPQNRWRVKTREQSVSRPCEPLNRRSHALFDSIESAHEYVQLLAEVVADVRKDLESDDGSYQGREFPRRQDAIRLALYTLGKLQRHMTTSSRILNDLRSLRRLLLEERQASVNIVRR